MYLDKNAILDALTTDDIITIMTDLGASSHRTERKSGALIFPTICHHHSETDSKYKLYYYHEPTERYPARMFYCYAQDGAMSLIHLVIQIKRMHGNILNFYQALKYIATITNKIIYLTNEEVAIQREVIPDWTWIKSIARAQNKTNNTAQELQSINENVLDLFCYYPHQLWLDEGISADVMSLFEIGYWSKDNSITIPFRDYQGRLIGVRGRHLNPADIEIYGKYYPLSVQGEYLSHPLSESFYGLCQNYQTIKKKSKVMLVEGEKSVLLNHTYFGDESIVLATCGSSLSATQINILIKQLDVSEVILAFDREYEEADSFAATIYYKKLLHIIEPLINLCKVTILLDTQYRLPYKASPCDVSKEMLLELLNEKHEVTKEEILQMHLEELKEKNGAHLY